jgi:hypothetical protein
MTAKINQQDVEKVAEQISRVHGSFSSSNLVNYGQTIVVKPGAATKAGKPIRGLEVAEALSGDYAVQPLAVTYGSAGPLPAEEDPDAFERAMNMELDSADTEVDEPASPAEGGEEAFGFDEFSPDDALLVPPRGLRLRLRYQRISSRFGRFAVYAVRTGSLRHRQAASRVFRRIRRLWDRMLRRGVPVVGLMSPSTLRRRVYELTQGASALQAPSQAAAPVFPLRAPMVSQAPGMPKPLAFDQAALERSVGISATNQLLTQSFGGAPSVSADARAETVGYLFSRMEHDYFGLISTPFQIVLTDEDEAVLDDDDDLQSVEQEAESPSAERVVEPAAKPKISDGLPDDDADLEAAEEGDIKEDAGSSIPDDDSDLEDLDVDEQGLALSDEDLEDDADLLDDDDDMLGLDEDDMDDLGVDDDMEFGKIVARGNPAAYAKYMRQFKKAFAKKVVNVTRTRLDWKQITRSWEKMDADERRGLLSPQEFLADEAMKKTTRSASSATHVDGSLVEKYVEERKAALKGSKAYAMGYGADDLPDDDSDIDAVLGADDDDDMLGLDEDDGLPDDDEDLLEDEPSSPPAKPAASAPAESKQPAAPKDNVSKAVDAAVDAVAEASSLVSTVKAMSAVPLDQVAEPVATSPEHAKRLAMARAKVNMFLSKLQSDAASAQARGDKPGADVIKERIVSLRGRLVELDKALRGASASGSINYGDLVPAPASAKDKIVVIAIRKSPAAPSAEKAEVQRYAQDRGVASDGHLADVFGADMVRGGRLQVSGSLAVSQVGAMSAEQAMSVFGAYLWGVDRELGRESLGAVASAGGASLKRFQKMSERYTQAKSSDDQVKAAAILGQMKVAYASLSAADRALVVDPATLLVPGIEIAKTVDPKSAAASANVDATIRSKC